MESTYLCLLLQKSGLIIIFILLLILLLCEEYFCFHKNIPRDTRTSMFTAVIVLFHLLDTTSIQMVHVLERRLFFFSMLFMGCIFCSFLCVSPCISISFLDVSIWNFVYVISTSHWIDRRRFTAIAWMVMLYQPRGPQGERI